MNLHLNVSLQSYNSFGLQCTADQFTVAQSVEDLEEALDTTEPITILGEGTNVVLKPKISGRVIRLALNTISVSQTLNDAVLVSAAAGVNWHELVRFTLGRGIAGLENLALIPGSVGGAPFQNIGAYGVELSEICEAVQVFDRVQRRARSLRGDECGFAYRDSIFKSASRDRFVICGLTLRLGTRSLSTHYKDLNAIVSKRSRSTLTPTYIAETVIRIRRNKLPDPRLVGNAGSFFKNPILCESKFDLLRERIDIQGHRESTGVKVSAARLIDEAGWKGLQHEGVAVWSRQPLVLVNRGGATARTVLELADRIADDIHRRFGVELELEPEVLGSY